MFYLRGFILSHGINLVYHYGKSILTGRKNPNQDFKIDYKYLSSKSLDANNTFGASAGYYAINNIKDAVNKYGTSSIGVFQFITLCFIDFNSFTSS